mmetsp:Transcript_35055/g.90939  ORF Transcript_35055/g.90939 Transcript_35055/m.90939 type:complete len:146 (-) Transcript_35055:69-506(-)
MSTDAMTLKQRQARHTATSSGLSATSLCLGGGVTVQALLLVVALAALNGMEVGTATRSPSPITTTRRRLRQVEVSTSHPFARQLQVYRHLAFRCDVEGQAGLKKKECVTFPPTVLVRLVLITTSYDIFLLLHDFLPSHFKLWILI